MISPSQYLNDSTPHNSIDATDLLSQLQRERARRVQLEAENTDLRSKIAGMNRPSKIVYGAIRDGYELLMRHVTDLSMSREQMQREGMSIRRWQWAIASLRYTNVLSIRSRVFKLKWFSTEKTELLQMFEEGTKRLLEAEKPLDSLRLHLPPSIRKA